MSKFKNKIKKQYENEGYTVLSLVRVGNGGYPDLLALKNGKAIFIECKEGADDIKPLQELRIDELKKNGFEAFCLHNTKGVIY